VGPLAHTGRQGRRDTQHHEPDHTDARASQRRDSSLFAATTDLSRLNLIGETKKGLLKNVVLIYFFFI